MDMFLFPLIIYMLSALRNFHCTDEQKNKWIKIFETKTKFMCSQYRDVKLERTLLYTTNENIINGDVRIDYENELILELSKNFHNCKLSKQFENRESEISNIRKCKCGGVILIIPRQTRSCDEDVTYIEQCSKCNKKI